MRIRELRRKEVINITDGGRLGFVGGRGPPDAGRPDGSPDRLRSRPFFRAVRQGERSTTSRGTASSGSGMTSSSSTSPPSTGTRHWNAAGGKNSDKKQLNVEFSEKRRKFHVFFEIILAIRFTLCYDNSAFRMAADSLFVPICKKNGLAEGRKQPEVQTKFLEEIKQWQVSYP